MTGTPSLLADLLANCDAHGIGLSLADGGGLTIDAPQDALTPKLLARLKAHKAELLALLQRDRPASPEAAQSTPDAFDGPGVNQPKRPAEAILARFQFSAKPCERYTPVCRCGSTTWRDVPIHEGQSVRRDCARCRRFLYFAVWYGIESKEPSLRLR